MLNLLGDHAKAKGMLKVRNAPRLACAQVIVTNADQKPRRQYRYAKGLLNTPFVLPHLMFTHSQF